MPVTLSRGKVARTSATKAKLNQVLQYRNRSVALHIQKELRDVKGQEITFAEAEAIFKKTLAFLWRCATHGKDVPDKSEDLGWHMFILHTLAYQEFCQKYIGHLIHHECLPLGKGKACRGVNCRCHG